MVLAERIDRAQVEDAEAVVPSGQVERRAVRQRIMLALLLVTAVKQVVLALTYPPFQGHDEVAHLGYLRIIDRFGRLPTFADNLPAGWSGYARYTLDWPALYTANHPPLYYVLAWPVYKLAGPDALAQLYAVRLVAIPCFLATVWLAYKLVTVLFPEDDFLVLTVPAVIAFQPQLSFEGAIVNNDMLAILFGTLLLYVCVLILRDGLSPRRAVVLGLVLGLGLLSKATLTALVPLVAGVALWSCRPGRWEALREGGWWRERLQLGLLLVLPVVVLVLPWYLFLKQTYGDFTAFRATQELQRDWNRPAGTFGELLGSREFHLERIHETWGYFGWKLLPLSAGELRAIYFVMALCAVGWLVGLARLARARQPGTWGGVLPVAPLQLAGVVLLATAWLLMYGAMIYFGTMFMLTQARYFFPILPAATVLALLGLRVLVPRRLLGPAAAVTIGAAGAFQVLLLTGLVFPYAVF